MYQENSTNSWLSDFNHAFTVEEKVGAAAIVSFLLFGAWAISSRNRKDVNNKPKVYKVDFKEGVYTMGKKRGVYEINGMRLTAA